MELKDIKEKIAELRTSASELANECYLLRARTNNPHTISVADYINYELTGIAVKLADLEQTETSEDFTPDETDCIDDATEIADWWTDLELRDKCELANIPYPTSTDGRGEELLETEERADRWWNSRTYEQKKETYEENLAWWDKE